MKVKVLIFFCFLQALIYGQSGAPSSQGGVSSNPPQDLTKLAKPLGQDDSPSSAAI